MMPIDLPPRKRPPETSPQLALRRLRRLMQKGQIWRLKLRWWIYRR